MFLANTLRLGTGVLSPCFGILLNHDLRDAEIRPNTAFFRSVGASSRRRWTASFRDDYEHGHEWKHDDDGLLHARHDRDL